MAGRCWLVVVVVLCAGALASCGRSSSPSSTAAGPGYKVVLKVNPGPGYDWPKSAEKRRDRMRAIGLILTQRLKLASTTLPELRGLMDPSVTIEDDDKVMLTLPGAKGYRAVLTGLLSTASLEFYHMRSLRSQVNPLGDWDVQKVGEAYIFTGPKNQQINSVREPRKVLTQVVGVPKNKPILTGRDLKPNASANINARNEIVLNIEFSEQGTQTFANFTRDHVGEYLAIFYDGKMLTCPEVREAILEGKAEVSGFKTLNEAKSVADHLNSGALPVPLKVVSVDPL